MNLHIDPLLCARTVPRARPRLLRAGPLRARLDGQQICYVALHDAEIVRRIYFAVRGPQWSTIPGEVHEVVIEQRADRFTVGFDVRHNSGDVNFSWHGRVVGHDGLLSYEACGQALSDFTYYRIGLCVLHPLKECMGAQFTADTATGIVRGMLPNKIGPKRYEEDGLDHVEIPAFRALSLETISGLVQFSFEGDLFELEDQRNYTDASFKSYSTPLSLPLERLATTGEVFYQRVAVRAEVRPPSRPLRRRRSQATLEATGSSAAGLPAIGFGLGRSPAQLSPAELDLLMPLHPSHLRVDLRLSRDGCREDLAAAAKVAASLGSSLELGLLVTDRARDQFRALVANTDLAVPVCRALVFHEDEVSTSVEWVDQARAFLAGFAAAIGGGTLGDFAEVNAIRPPADAFDVVTWRSSPQVHADDEASMVETLPVLEEILRTAKGFCGRSALVVSPITLKPWTPSLVVDSGGESVPAAPPLDADARQASLFCAAWTLGSLKYLSRGCARALTYYELTGERGLMAGDQPLLRDALVVQSGDVFPLYHVFLDVQSSPSARFLDCDASSPDRVDGFGLATSSALTYLAANMTPSRQACRVGPVECGEVMVRRLSAESARTAMAYPRRFRRLRDREPVSNGRACLMLEPFEVVRIDLPAGARGL